MKNGVNKYPPLRIISDPNPQRAPMQPTAEAALEAVDELQRIYCTRRTHCLTTAIKLDWDNFHCNDCNGFVEPTSEEVMRDTDACLHLLAVVDLSKKWGER